MQNSENCLVFTSFNGIMEFKYHFIHVMFMVFTVFQTGNGRFALILYFWTILLIFGLSPSYSACVNEDLVDRDILAKPGYCLLNFFKAFVRTKLAKPSDRVATSPMNKARLANLILSKVGIWHILRVFIWARYHFSGLLALFIIQ